jgi:hypothetical protein
MAKVNPLYVRQIADSVIPSSFLSKGQRLWTDKTNVYLAVPVPQAADDLQLFMTVAAIQASTMSATFKAECGV